MTDANQNDQNQVIRDIDAPAKEVFDLLSCLLYTSDAADDTINV